MTHRLVNIAIPVPVPRTFTYLLPEQFEGLVQKGSLVLVPFGTKKCSGIVLDFPDATDVTGLKPVIDVLDPFPVLSECLLKLGAWLAEYYCSPIGETLRIFLPQGIGQSSKRIVTLACLPSEAELARMSSSRRKIVETLRVKSALTILQLQKLTGLRAPGAIVSALAQSGLVTIEEHLAPKKANVRHERFLRCLPEVETAEVRGAKQTAALAYLRTSGIDWQSVPEFMKATGTSSAIVRTFVERGLIEIEERDIERTAYEMSADDELKQRAIQLNAKQREAAETIISASQSNAAQTFLLYGITGSGKTQVYIEALRAVLAQGKTAIVLVPEISLTPQTVRRFRAHFGDSVIVMHSRMSIGERYDAWRLTREGKYKIVIGPRSALFAPLANIGLIVVDEEHESSYKQFDAMPRYHARDAAIVRGMFERAVVVLGSATPSLETYTNAKAGKYVLLELPDRIDTARLPAITIVNMSDEHKRRFAEAKVRARDIGKKAFEGEFHGISKLLEEKMRERLEKKEGIILLQNRRGFAPFIECDDCGYVERCDRCEVTYTYHLTKKHLRCHYCGRVKPVPTVCPQCKCANMKMHGLGTQRVEQDVTALFPEAKLLRMDLDTTTRKGAHDKMLRQFGEGGADILLGTQMVAKGLDFSRVTLVGVISADTQMSLPDFRSAERTFQLLTQVAGRAGRSALTGEVVIQTMQPTHYALKHVVTHDFIGFYNEEIEFRCGANYPPYTRVILVELKGHIEQKIQHAAEEFVQRLAAVYPSITILGPAPAVISKIMNNYRWQLLVKSNSELDKNGSQARAAVRRVYYDMLATVGKRSGIRLIVDVDPQSTM
ncbi:MAG TPA: primosomal protein N' [Bacteroidota bacterium]|nr:primosomal protein N' [Bacteroidota bacterium]